MKKMILKSVLNLAEVVLLSFVVGCSTANRTLKRDENLVLQLSDMQGSKITTQGLSYLVYQGRTELGCDRFVTGTDRGPNSEGFKFSTFQGEKQFTVEGRRFPKPDFTPKLFRLLVCGTDVALEAEIVLKNRDGKPLTGLPPRSGILDGAPFDEKGGKIAGDIHGIDPEALAIDSRGHYWVGEEYFPAIMEFDQNGVLLRKLIPRDSLKSDEITGQKFEDILPSDLNHRMLNRGFEAIAIVGDELYMAPQSSLVFGEQLKSESKIVRIFVSDIKSNKILRQYLYPMESKFNKLGDMSVASNGSIFILEQNGNEGVGGFRKVYELSFGNARDVLSFSNLKPFELMSEKELERFKSGYIQKKEVLDLVKVGFNFEKIEGLAIMDSKHLAVVNDNDFGVANQFGDKPADSYLGIFNFESAK